MSKTVTKHVTGIGEIMFMAAAKALNNKRSGKTEFSIKLKLAEDDPCVTHLTSIADYKVNTKTNRGLTGTGVKVINFTSEFAPTVIDANDNVLKGTDIPFFDGRTDKGTAAVEYSVVDYGNNQIVRLSGIKLLNLELAPREDGGLTKEEVSSALKAIKA